MTNPEENNERSASAVAPDADLPLHTTRPDSSLHTIRPDYAAYGVYVAAMENSIFLLVGVVAGLIIAFFLLVNFRY